MGLQACACCVGIVPEAGSRTLSQGWFQRLDPAPHHGAVGTHACCTGMFPPPSLAPARSIPWLSQRRELCQLLLPTPLACSLLLHRGGGSLRGSPAPSTAPTSPPSFPAGTAPAGSPSRCSRPQGCSPPPWGTTRHLPPLRWPKIAALQQVLWFLMASFSCPRGGKSPSPALCHSPAALCGADAVTGQALAPIYPGNVWGCASMSWVRGWLVGKQHSLLPGIASLPSP